MKKGVLGILVSLCLLVVPMIAPAIESAEGMTLPTTKQSAGNFRRGGKLVFITRDEFARLLPVKSLPASPFGDEVSSRRSVYVRNLPTAFSSAASQQAIDSNGDAFVLELFRRELHVFDAENELKLSKKIEFGNSRHLTDWRIALSDRFVWIWSNEEKQFAKFDKATLEQVDVIDDPTNATGSMQMAGGPKDELYVWSSPYVWLIKDDWLARIDLRQFRVTSQIVALTVADDGTVYAVDPVSSQLFLFDAGLETSKAFTLADFDGSGPLDIYVWSERIYLLDVETGIRWDLNRPRL